MISVSGILENIIDYLNYNKSSSLPTIRFDLLSVKEDSCCISTANQQVTEKLADVTGGWVEGKITLKVMYRQLVNVKGTDELPILNIVDDLLYTIKNNYKAIYEGAEDWFIYSVTDINNAKLERVYQNSCKDYSGTLVITYNRKI